MPSMALLLIVLGGLLLFDGLVARLLFDVPDQLLSIMVAVGMIVQLVSRFLSLILRMYEQGLAFSMSQVLPKLLLLAIIGIYILIGVSQNLTSLVLAYVATFTLTCMVFAWNTRQEWLASFQQSVDAERLKPMLRFGLPLVLNGVAFWGLTATDKVLLRVLSSYQELGLYTVAVSFAAAGIILQSVFSTIWAPTVYRWVSKGECLERVDQVSRYVLFCVVIIFCLTGLFSWLVTFILPDRYDDVQWLVISCLGYPLLYTLSETTVVGIGVTRRTGFAMLAAVLAFATNAVGNWYLIPSFGAAGAAVSTIIAFLVFFILRTEFSMFLWRPIPRLVHYCYTTVLVFGSILSTLYGEQLSWLTYSFWLVVLLASFWTFRAEVGQLKQVVLYRLGNQ
ncbi:Polysaccharide biosynthesis C-terminal domain-containing protein [Modicisalibacter muralis]|uniref:Polysaccharide biosynthesis C-terminal domain-containing protein n=2 Tax=Modicisalibacter muralis TaxID=119000 RepID=A0A1G9M080_9GAMM|nr:Polysaccharide biosynthesis C-terminal domain-containing protein [Halomonas muralis]